MKRFLCGLALLSVLGCTPTMQVGDKIKDPATGVERPATADDVIEILKAQIAELEAAKDGTDAAIPWSGPAAGVGLIASAFLGTRLQRKKKALDLLLAHNKAKGISLPDGLQV